MLHPFEELVSRWRREGHHANPAIHHRLSDVEWQRAYLQSGQCSLGDIALLGEYATDPHMRSAWRALGLQSAAEAQQLATRPWTDRTGPSTPFCGWPQ